MNFCRVLWGTDKRRIKVNKDISFAINAPYNFKWITYVYGYSNYHQLKLEGLECKLIGEQPRMFPEKSEFGHKLYAWTKMAEDFDKFIFLDWDVVLTRPLPENFDESLKDKKLQISCRQYFNPKCRWRKKHSRKTSCASWFYCGDRTIPNQWYQIWEDMKRPWREEICISKWTEKDGVFDLDYYWENFEPHGDLDYFHLKNETVYKERENKGNSLFKHFAKHK